MDSKATNDVGIRCGTGPFDRHRLDLGSELQFITSIGFDWELSPRWILGYRWQHISNAGVRDRNPGLNLNTISVGFRF